MFIKFTTIDIHIQNFVFSTTKKDFVNDNCKIELKIFVLKKVRIIKISFNKNKIKKIIIKILNKKETGKRKPSRIKKFRNRIFFKNRSSMKQNFLKSIFKVKNMELIIYIGVEDAAVCALATGFTSSILSIFLVNLQKEKNSWSVIPVYQNRNFLELKLDCVITINLKELV